MVTKLKRLKLGVIQTGNPKEQVPIGKGLFIYYVSTFIRRGGFINKHFLVIFISTNMPQGMVLEEASYVINGILKFPC